MGSIFPSLLITRCLKISHLNFEKIILKFRAKIFSNLKTKIVSLSMAASILLIKKHNILLVRSNCWWWLSWVILGSHSSNCRQEEVISCLPNHPCSSYTWVFYLKLQERSERQGCLPEASLGCRRTKATVCLCLIIPMKYKSTQIGKIYITIAFFVNVVCCIIGYVFIA